MQPRPLTKADLPAASALEAQAEAHVWSAAQLAEELRTGLGLGVFDEELVGHAYFRAQHDEWWLLQLRVREDRRRRGLGRALLEAGLARAPEACASAWLEVAEDNAGALALYGALGFTERGRRPRYYSDGRAAVLLSVRLPAFGP